MNQRIKLLAEQAGAVFTNSHAASLLDDEMEKFAELLVEECCRRLGEETIRHDGYGYNQHELYNRLRKHFGVER
jgi:hypothetical protein